MRLGASSSHGLSRALLLGGAAIVAMGLAAGVASGATTEPTPQIVVLKPTANANAKAVTEVMRGNDVTDVYTAAIDGFVASLDPADITRLRNDPSVISVEPDQRVSINAAPGNDSFASATGIAGASGNITGTTRSATRQTGEPKPLSVWGNSGSSIWYSWTATDTGTLSLSTVGSNYDTMLAIYTGSAVGALTVLPNGANDDFGAGLLTSSVSVNVTAGTTYRIVIDGYGRTSGNTKLNWLLTPTAPVNDAFAQATAITGSQGSVTGSTAFASRESGEPNHGGSGTASVWYSWTAPDHGVVSLFTTGSSFATLLGAYTGTAVRALTPVVATDTTPLGSTRRGMSFTVTPNTTYRIAIDGASGATGSVTLGWNFVSVAPITAPDPPLAVAAGAPSGTSVTVSVTPPVSDGGSAILSYTVSCSSSTGGITRTGTSTDTSVLIVSLTPGSTYTCRAKATNAQGISQWSGASSGFVMPTAPGAPKSVTAIARDGAATVSWVAPTSNGGSDITDYTAVASGGNPRTTCTTALTTCGITGLTNGVAYTFTVRATNAVGQGSASAASAPVTPAVPIAPLPTDPTPGPAPTEPGTTDPSTPAPVTGPGLPQNREAFDWGIDRLDQRGNTLDNRYVVPLDGTGVTAYVIDTGVLASHEEFGGRVLGGLDGVGDGSGTEDCNGHGTHVAGSIAGRHYGVAPMARVVPVRVLGCTGDGSVSDVIAGINWMVSNHVAGTPAVANMSMGTPSSSALNRAVDTATADGITMAVAAGNSNTDACTMSPASAPTAISVGATDDQDARAPFSDYGPCVTVFAPGVDIESAWSSDPKATEVLSGTSMAAPHAAGVAALLLSGTPGAAPAQVRQGIIDGATPGVVSNPGGGSPNLLLFAAASSVPMPTAQKNSQSSNAVTAPSKVPRIKSLKRTKKGLRIVVTAPKGAKIKVFVNGKRVLTTASHTPTIRRTVRKGAKITVKMVTAEGTSKASNMMRAPR